MKKSLPAILAASALALLAPALVAQETVAQFQFNPPTNPPLNSYASTVESPLGSVSLIGYPSGGGGYTSSFGGGYFRNNSGNIIPESLAGSLSNGIYLGFTFTPVAAVEFDTLTFTFGASNATSIAGGIVYTGNWAAFTSVDGFESSASLATGSTSQTAHGSNVFTPSWTTFNVDLASLAASSTPVEFRIYFWDDNTTSTSNLQLRFDDVVLTASAAAIPEPGTYAALCGALALGLVAWRRRRGRVTQV